VQRFRGGLVFKAHRLCASLNSRLESNKEEEEEEDLHRPLARWSRELRCHPQRPASDTFINTTATNYFAEM